MIEGLIVKDPHLYICVPKQKGRREEINTIFLWLLLSCCFLIKIRTKNKMIPRSYESSLLYKILLCIEINQKSLF